MSTPAMRQKALGEGRNFPIARPSASKIAFDGTSTRLNLANRVGRRDSTGHADLPFQNTLIDQERTK
jgi:hypothetical protein